MLKYFNLHGKPMAMSIEINVDKESIVLKLKLCNELLFAALNLNFYSFYFICAVYQKWCIEKNDYNLY